MDELDLPLQQPAAWVSLYGDRVLCNQNPFVPRGCTLWVCSQRHRFRTILPR